MKIVNHPSILKASAVKITDGCHPIRLVLRHEEGYMPYIVHVEQMTINGNEVSHVHFYDGRYFVTLSDAEYDFNERTSGAYSL